MTVGISAICRKDGEPRAIVAADRMVTVGNSGGIEYEDSDSKLTHIVDNENVSAVAVGAGVSTYIDGIFKETEGFLAAEGNVPPSTVKDVRDYALAAYKSKVQESIQNQILSPYSYTLDELKNPDVSVPETVQKELIAEIQDVQESVNNRVHILLAGVDSQTAEVFQIVGNDYTNFSDIGYSVIGSGRDSARLTFIRREYDRTCSHDEGVFTVLEAKDQAEERQGVGRRTDMVMVEPGNIIEFDPSQLGQLEDDLETIGDREKQVRENVINDWSMSSE